MDGSTATKMTVQFNLFGGTLLNLGNNKLHSKYLKNSLALVVPSNESYGSKIKIIEALCYGVPVITTKIGIRGIYLGNFIRWDPKAQHEKMIKRTIFS